MAEDGRFSDKPHAGKRVLAHRIVRTPFVPTKSISNMRGPGVRLPARPVLA